MGGGLRSGGDAVSTQGVRLRRIRRGGPVRSQLGSGRNLIDTGRCVERHTRPGGCSGCGWAGEVDLHREVLLEVLLDLARRFEWLPVAVVVAAQFGRMDEAALGLALTDLRNEVHDVPGMMRQAVEVLEPGPRLLWRRVHCARAMGLDAAGGVDCGAGEHAAATRCSPKLAGTSSQMRRTQETADAMDARRGTHFANRDPNQGPDAYGRSASSTASGCLAMTANKTLAGPSGRVLPCSQFFTEAGAKPKRAANFD